MRKFSKIIVLLLFVTTCAFADWTGSTSEPANMKKIDGKSFYVITSADELAWFAAKVNGGSTDINAVLANDIVFGKNMNTIGTVSWTPIGYSNVRQFAGIFDGAGYTIYGLYVKSSSTSGFIGYLTKTGVVKNIIMANGKISAETTYTGAIVAFNYGTIQNTENRNTIEGYYYAGGGIVGVNSGVVSNCNNQGIIISRADSSGGISGASGGIVGINEEIGEIYNCYNRGDVSTLDTTIISMNLAREYSASQSSMSGGIAGSNVGIISDCYNSSNVETRAYLRVTNTAGGIATARATTYTGGIVGRNSGNVFRCYNIATNIYSSSNSNASSGKGQQYFTEGNNIQGVEGSPGTKAISYSYSGGISGYNTGLIHDCYSNYTGQSSSQAYSAYIKLVPSNVNMNIDGLRSKPFAAVTEERTYQDGIVGQNTSGGSTKSSYYKTEYWLNNTKVTGTAENMQKDQFAWILNTCNGTEENSGTWTRGANGYPTFANDDSLAIYKVAFNDDGAMSNRYTNYLGYVTFPDDPDPTEGYVFAGWFNSENVKVKSSNIFTADQTINAMYVDASDVYWTINFYNAAPADTILETKSYQHGSIVTYGGGEPTLTSTAKYTYTFKGWDVEPTNAVEDFNYHALYDSTIRSYTIVFNNSDGSEIETATFEYGKMPSCSKIPTRATNAEWQYTHKGWKPALDYVTEDATYTAIYDSSKVEYKVTFMNGTDVIDEQMVPYGDAAIAPTNVTREGHKFVGWNTSFSKITENLTIKALFEELTYYTVNVVDENGEKIDEQKVEDGEKYVLPEATKKDGYTFDGWYNVEEGFVGNPGDEITITGNLVVKAQYTVISYTITFADEDGTEISSAKVAYGTLPMAPEDPTKASSAQYTYTFAGWDKEITKVTGSTTYTATYNSSVRSYTITFANEDGTEISSAKVAYGTLPMAPEDPTKASSTQYTYTFAGWDKEITKVTGATTYTATYSTTLRSYTITFADEDGSEISSVKVAYGALPIAPEDPTKASSAQYTYTFAGWDKKITKVTESTTYTATYNSSVRSYTITFADEDGTEISSAKVAYGTLPMAPEDPTKASTAQYTYAFAGWDKEITKVTGAVIYTATYNKLVRNYTVTFLDFDGSVLDEQSVAYGNFAESPENPIRKGYKFIGWDTDYSYIVKAIDVTALYEKLSSSSSAMVSSSSTVKSSSSAKSSSSEKGQNVFVANNIPVFNVFVVERNVQIVNAKAGSTLIVFDMQGRIILTQTVNAVNFAISLPQAGRYIIRVDQAYKVVHVK